MRITEAYREQNRQLHENPAYGVSGKKWAGLVNDTYTQFQCVSALDYGCGKQTLAAAVPHLMIQGYDPAIAGLDAEPDPADLVICGDVLEHVEEECVDDVLDHLQKLSKKVIILVAATRPAIKTLPDGRNAHITIKPGRWWLERIMLRWDVRTYSVRVGQDKMEQEAVFIAVPFSRAVPE